MWIYAGQRMDQTAMDPMDFLFFTVIFHDFSNSTKFHVDLWSKPNASTPSCHAICYAANHPQMVGFLLISSVDETMNENKQLIDDITGDLEPIGVSSGNQ